MTWSPSSPLLGILWVVLALVALLGGAVAYRAWAAFRARPSTPMLLLGAGLSVLALGMPSLWVVLYLATEDLLWCSLGATTVALGGFALILGSLQTRRA
ncbi:MAG TPA: hypothetical protein VGS23_01595 [Thermoplasmata archaeon]|nr:hypothetical protein [Thermoplasmata archaeon]